MTYPIRVINNRVKTLTTPALVLELGKIKGVAAAKKKPTAADIICLVLLVALILCTILVSSIFVVMPLSDIVSRESSLAREIRDINSSTPDISLRQLLASYDIPIISRTNLGETQSIVTIDNETPLYVLLHIIAQIPGVFSLQYSQDGFQIFIAGGSV